MTALVVVSRRDAVAVRVEPRVAQRLRLEGIVEAAHAHVMSVTGIVFDPALFYGRNDLWVLSVGIRVATGVPVHRMGRYGVAMAAQSLHEHHQ